ncbi:MAG: 50S ribosomal protein L11 methyltransferase [Acidobacteriia bacterium]|nr:50S ribosomal protein L11 methyltransferase [Terriglobia bacterium]
MFSLEIECDPDDRDFLVAELWEHGCAGIVELDARRVRAFFEDGARRDALLQMYPGSAFRVEEQRDWVQSARDLLQPMEVGRRFYLVPAWRDDPAPAGRFRIAVNPGLAFGTGLHESTQLCMEALEDYLRPGMGMLDVGAGSGILARAAQLLGAERIYACDIDHVAVEIAGKGGLPNRFIGSVDAVASGSMDVVVANINPEVILQLAPDLLRVRRDGGVLLASGLERNEVEMVKAALPAPPREIREKGNWALIVA